MDVLIVRLVDFDESERLPRLYVTRGDSTVPVEFNSSGEALILVEDDDVEEVRLHNEQFEHMVDMGPIRLAATPEQARFIDIPPSAHLSTTPTPNNIPPPSTFRTRVRPQDLESAVGAKLIFGLPPTEHLPVNQVERKYSSTYLDSAKRLVPGAAVAGKLYEFETHWQPLGWALDEWIDTISLGPSEDSMLAAAEINATAATTADSRGETSDRSDQGTRTTSSSDRTMELTASAAARSKGFSAGLTGTNSNSATLTLDPILSLVRAVTGAFQLGYNSSSVTSNADTTGDIVQRLSSGLDQATSQLRIDNAAAMSDAVNQLSDRRRLRALRNAAGAQTLNLAVFAVNRQWLVTTAHLRTRNVMLIPVEKYDQAFEVEEIFLHAEVLTGVLLDRSLSDTLNRVAQAYVPEKAQPAPAAPGVRSLRFGYTIDRSLRHDAHASVQAHFVTNGTDGRSVASVLPVGAGSHEVIVLLDRPLSTLTRLTVEYDSGHIPHHSITLEAITVVAEFEDRSTQQLAVELTNLGIEHGGISALDFTGFTWARPTTATNRDVARVKAHLDANRSYYRLAIDLQRSDISRFTDSEFWRNPASDKPIEPHPVGIAGAHLAFLCNEQSNRMTKHRQLRATSQLLSVPTGATFLDALPGALKLKVPEKSDLGQPTVLAPASATIAWPTVVQPTALTTTRAAAAPAAAGATALATSTLPDLAAQITAFAAKLDAIQASLTKVQTDVQKATPAAPTAPAKDASAAKAKGGTDGAATSKADT